MDELTLLATRLGEGLSARGWQLAVAESCTGGWIAKTCTDVSGASAWFDRGFVTYSNQSKQDLLGVSADTLARHGAVSQAVVLEMAAGACQRAKVQLAVAVSGVAGPGGGTPTKPVGTVWIAWAGEHLAGRARHYLFDGDRDAVRHQAVAAALQGLLDYLD
jgi:nicotinamide-nucleotide amidase